MRNSILVLLLTLVLPFSLSAQDKKDLTFVYIAHDVNTPVQTLCERLTDLYNDAMDYPDERAVIFYLANSDNPIVCRMNVPGSDPSAFEDIISEIQTKRSHDNEPLTDINTIMSLFEEEDLVDRSGDPNYSSVTWNWYINSTFWELEYNRSIIAPIYYIFNMDELIKDRYLAVNFFHGENDPIPYLPSEPFGSLYSGISFENCPLMPY